MEAGPPGYYEVGSLDGSRPGTFLANIGNYKDLPRYDIIRQKCHLGL